jgi:hypothetical protein
LKGLFINQASSFEIGGEGRSELAVVGGSIGRGDLSLQWWGEV